MKREISVSELIYLARMENQDAFSELLKRYEERTISFVRNHINTSGYKGRLNDEFQDFLQVANATLCNCVYSYNDRDADFYHYASCCMLNAIRNIIRGNVTKKGKIDLEAFSLDNQIKDGENMYFVDMAPNNQPSFEGPYCMDITKNSKVLVDKIKEDIGDEYAEICNLKLQGYKHREIGEKLQMKTKKVSDCYNNIRKFYNGTLTKK